MTFVLGRDTVNLTPSQVAAKAGLFLEIEVVARNGFTWPSSRRRIRQAVVRFVTAFRGGLPADEDLAVLDWVDGEDSPDHLPPHSAVTEIRAAMARERDRSN